MIIFDLDGTLADCEHRRKYIVAAKNPDYEMSPFNYNTGELAHWRHKETKKRFVPKWDQFYEECDKDIPIHPVVEALVNFLNNGYEIQIWSGRSESVRIKTHAWILAHTGLEPDRDNVKMRPIGDSTPDDQLKEMWLNERCADLMEAKIDDRNPKRHGIQFVFDDRPKVVDMWRRREIFVFNCHQSNEVF